MCSSPTKRAQRGQNLTRRALLARTAGVAGAALAARTLATTSSTGGENDPFYALTR
jgi:hypothetical protein